MSQRLAVDRDANGRTLDVKRFPGEQLDRDAAVAGRVGVYRALWRRVFRGARERRSRRLPRRRR
ncbi:hypothetical protein [Halobacterium sp. KA-6]|uniref:hypothetical protein n=1 Tax=Halobacterium sp. KA-6 TaxID=2896368 RepID=UPI001E40B0C4|nr:hypothetical protein [Halobacterium sp. KA-6]